MIITAPEFALRFMQKSFWVCLKIPSGVPLQDTLETRCTSGSEAISDRSATFRASAGSATSLACKAPDCSRLANAAHNSDTLSALGSTPSSCAIVRATAPLAGPGM
jgi:hypothetical protein